MRAHLAFGKTGIVAELPEGFRYSVLEARTAQPVADETAAIEQALDHPIGCPPLRELAAGKRTAAISVCDITRPAPNRLVLPPLLRRLEAAGIPPSEIVILIATGLHRPATPNEIREIVGDEVAAAYRVENHYAREIAHHRFLGHTAAGTPVYIDQRFLDAGLHITLGFIEPHLMLGFSGGRKLIVPGLAGQETIKAIHSPKFMRQPRAVEGCIDGNPLHAELLEIAAMARHDFMVDVALTRERRIAAVFAGEPRAAHQAGVGMVSNLLLERLEEPVDAAVTTAAGYPLDLTFYQSLKGVTAASHIVKPGGRILLVAACEEGPGAPEFSRMLREHPSDEGFLRHIENAPVVVDQWQLEKLALVTREKRVLFYTPGLPPEYHANLWGPIFPTLEAAIEGLTAGLPPDARIAVIPEGPYVLAKVL